MRHSHLGKLLLILVGLVSILQLANHVASRAVIRDNLIDNARRELAQGGDVFATLMETRAAQLASSVDILVADFAFREAVATGEEDTIRSALRNHAGRIRADLARLVTPQGHEISLTGSDDNALVPKDLFSPQVSIEAVDGTPYILIRTPVNTPALAGWVSLGFIIDEALAWNLAQVTGMDVSFAVLGKQPVLASTLPAVEHEGTLRWLLRHNPGDDPVDADINGTRRLTLLQPLADDIIAVLQLPMAQVLAPYTSLGYQLLWLTISGLLLALLASVLMARSVSKPVRALAEASRRITAGDYNTEMPQQNADEFGELARAFNAMQEAIAEREDRLVHQAEHDALTSLPNRSVALMSLDQAIREEAPFAVMAADLNRFKEINDALGHSVGDQVLQVIARRLDSSVKSRDLAARLGADEFILLLRDVDTAQAIKIAHRLRNIIEQVIELNDLELNVEASSGIALFPEHGSDAETLMRRADIAMYDAKQAGHQVAVYQAGWDERHLRRLGLARDLKEALVDGSLQLLYQPKATLRDRERIGAEALIRWHHPKLGLLRPDEFIAIAEDAGHITRLTRWVLQTAVSQLQQWHRQHLMIQLSVNISAQDLLDESLPGFISNLLANAEVEPQALCLEITESSVMQDEQQGHAMLSRLKGIGLRLAVDDFGTGYSSLSQLKRMPVDELKIDKSFVMNLDHSDDDAVIVHSTIELGHNMGLEVVAEGVENRDAVMLLESFGCDMIQGYLLGKPMPADALSSWAQGWLKQPTLGDIVLAS